MPTLEEYNNAIAAGHSPAELDAYLRSKQMTGPMRLPAMVGSEALAGLESLESVPAQVLTALARNVGQPLADAVGLGPIPEVPNIEHLSDSLGLTNNPRLLPGYGPNPATEELLAGTARGVGGALPMFLGGPVLGSIGVGLGALGGASGEVLRQNFPNNPILPIAAPMALGLLGGGAAGVMMAQRAAAAAPSVAQQFGDITAGLGAGDTTIRSAGLNLKNALNTRTIDFLQNEGLQNVAAAQPHKIPDMILKDPDLAEAVRRIEPDAMDQITGAMILRNPRQWNRLQPEVQNSALPDPEMQSQLETALDAAKKGGTNPMAELAKQGSNWRYIIGGGLGLMAQHLGVLPHYVDPLSASFLGEAAGELYHRSVSNQAARMILQPIMNPTPAGKISAGALGLGAVGGANPGSIEPNALLPQ